MPTSTPISSRADLRHGPANGAAIVTWDIGGGGAPYEIGVYFPGQPEAGATMLQRVTSRAFAHQPDRQPRLCRHAQVNFLVQKNGTSIGVITLAAANTAAFAFEIAFAGDRLTMLRREARTRASPTSRSPARGTRT
jgi:hypothetical protein